MNIILPSPAKAPAVETSQSAAENGASNASAPNQGFAAAMESVAGKPARKSASSKSANGGSDGGGLPRSGNVVPSVAQPLPQAPSIAAAQSTAAAQAAAQAMAAAQAGAAVQSTGPVQAPAAPPSIGPAQSIAAAQSPASAQSTAAAQSSAAAQSAAAAAVAGSTVNSNSQIHASRAGAAAAGPWADSGAVQENGASAGAAASAADEAHAADDADDADDADETASASAETLSVGKSKDTGADAIVAAALPAGPKSGALRTTALPKSPVAVESRANDSSASTQQSTAAGDGGEAAGAGAAGAAVNGGPNAVASVAETAADEGFDIAAAPGVAAQNSVHADALIAPAGSSAQGIEPDAASALAAAGASATAAAAASAASVITALAASTAVAAKHVRAGADSNISVPAAPSIDGAAVASTSAGAALAAGGTISQSSDAATATMKISANVDGNEFGQGLANHISTLVDRNITSAKIQVNPPALGPIEVRISVQGDHAQVWMVSHSAVTRDALQSSTPTLRAMLGDQGFGQVSVDISQRSFQDRNPTAPSYEWHLDADRGGQSASTGTVGSATRAASSGALDAYA
jgi:flagellar hook-length control protein FliK